MAMMDSPHQLHFQALQHYQEGNFLQTIQTLLPGLTDEPQAGLCWNLKGVSHYGLGETAQARNSLEVASTLIPLPAESRVILGECYLSEGRTRWALEEFRGLLSEPDLTPELLLRVAEQLDKLDEPQLALQACRSAARHPSQSAIAFYQMSYYMARLGSPLEQVESVARQAIALDPQCISFRVGLASLLGRCGRTRPAYGLIRNLTFEQIRELNCPPCLRRIQAIYIAEGDQTRTDWCRECLESLPDTGRNCC